MNLAKMSVNGQITIPVEVRRKLKLSSGDKLVFICNSDGEIIVKNLDVTVITQTLGTGAK